MKKLRALLACKFFSTLLLRLRLSTFLPAGGTHAVYGNHELFYVYVFWADMFFFGHFHHLPKLLLFQYFFPESSALRSIQFESIPSTTKPTLCLDRLFTILIRVNSVDI